MRIIYSLPLLFASCAVDPSDRADESTVDQAIANGTFVTTPGWSVIGPNGCTASVLNERWLLTAAHCIDSDTSMLVSFAPSLGGIATLYSGHVKQFANPDHPGSSNAEHDVGLVYLEDAGIDLTTLGRAKLYSDVRRPWRDDGQLNNFFFEGWGLAGDDCTDPLQRLRWGAGQHVDYNPGNTHYASAAIGDVHMCGGDSGAQYLLYRGIGSDADYMQFAVHSGRRVTTVLYIPAPTLRHQGALIEDNTAWIESTIDAYTSQVFDPQWANRAHGGFAFRQSEFATPTFNDLLGFQYRCMHDDDAKTNHVQLRTCSGSLNQRWKFTLAGEIRRDPGGFRQNLCLQMTNNSTANRTPMMVATCNGSMAQRFVFTSGGQLQSAINRAKCVEAGGSTEGAPVQLFDCNGTAPQMWLP